MNIPSLEYKCEYSVTLDGVAFYVFASDKNASHAAPYLGALHNHYTSELHYIHKGSAHVRTDKESISLSEGDLCFVGKSVYHHVFTEGMLRTSFNVEVGKGGAEEKNYRNILLCLAHLGDYRVFRDAYVNALMGALVSVPEDGFSNMHRALLMLGVFLRVIDVVARENGIRLSGFGKMKRSRDFERKRVIEYHIEQCYAMEGGIRLLAASLFLSEKQTGITVQRLMGESYKTLLTRQRMRVANRLMRGDKSLLEIAHCVGYASYNGFFVAYQKYFSLSPEEARAKIRAGAFPLGETEKED